MATVKYPDGTIRELNDNKPIKQANYKKSRLGTDFENRINESNEYYLNEGLAAIYKKPTPVQVVKVDYPARNKAKISEAYYKTPSTTDYNGIYRKMYIDFEAKSCKEDIFSFERIYEHQIKHLENIYNLGGISFLIIEFSTRNEVYVLPTPLLVDKYNESLNGGRKSIPYEYIKENGYLVEQKYKPRLAYLDVIDDIYFNKELFIKK